MSGFFDMVQWYQLVNAPPLVRVVAAYNAVDDETIVVTVYEPDPAEWNPDFRRKAR